MAEQVPNGVTLRVPIQAFLSSDHVTPATGVTIACTISKNGAAYGNPSGGATNATEIGSGSYYVDLSTTDTGTNGPLFVKGTSGTIDNVIAIYNVVNQHNGGFDALPNIASGAAGAALVDGVGTAAISNSAGKVLLQATQSGVTIPTVTTVTNIPGAIRSSTAQAGSTIAFIKLDASASATNSLYNGSIVLITGGTGAGQARTIVSYNGTTKNANVDWNWTTAPDNTSTFSILAADNAAVNASLQVTANTSTTIIRSGTAQTGSTSTTIKLDSGASATNNIYVGDTVSLTGGTGLGQSRLIVAYNGTTKVATVSPAWTTTPDNTTTFNILASLAPSIFSDQGVAQAGSASTITLASTASAVSSIYVGSIVTILAGTDVGDTSVITAYNGSTKVATVSPNFAVTPDTTSAYAVIPTQSGTGTLPGTQDVNVVSFGSTPVTMSGGLPEMIVGSYITGQDPATLWAAAALAACIGLPTTNGAALTYQVQQRNNKEHADKASGVITLYESDGTTVKSTQTYADTSTTADRSAMA